MGTPSSEIEAWPEPRAASRLLGHEDQERRVQQWHDRGQLPHALLLCGPWGIGKATFAWRVARLLLCSKERFGSKAGTAEQWLQAGTHPDLLVVERRFDERRGRTLQEIVVDDVRRIGGFLATSPACGGWRVVIVDAADEMNRNAANALLKVLEEPGSLSLILLVSHQPALLPATIRSRCRRLLLQPLADNVMRTLAADVAASADPADLALLLTLAEGSIGRLLFLLRHDGLAVYRAFSAFFGAVESGDGEAVLSAVSDGKWAMDEEGFRVVAHVLLWWLRRLARNSAGVQSGRPGAGEEVEAEEGNALVQRLAGTATLDQWLQVWEKTQRLVAHAASGNLDRKQVLSAVLLDMQRELRGLE